MPIQSPTQGMTDDLRTIEDREETLVIDLAREAAEGEVSPPPEVWLG